MMLFLKNITIYFKFWLSFFRDYLLPLCLFVGDYTELASVSVECIKVYAFPGLAANVLLVTILFSPWPR